MIIGVIMFRSRRREVRDLLSIAIVSRGLAVRSVKLLFVRSMEVNVLLVLSASANLTPYSSSSRFEARFNDSSLPVLYLIDIAIAFKVAEVSRLCEKSTSLRYLLFERLSPNWMPILSLILQ
jgi:hypothetical protein